MVSASHGLSSRPFAAPAQPHRPPRPAARAQARLAHLYRGWHRLRAPRCHRQRTRAAEAPLAGACGETASVSARLPAAARRTGRPSSRAAPSEPSGRPHRSVGGSSVSLLSSARRRPAGRARRGGAVRHALSLRAATVQRHIKSQHDSPLNFYVSLSPSGSLVTQPQLLCSAHTWRVNALVRTDGERKKSSKDTPLTRSCTHDTCALGRARRSRGRGRARTGAHRFACVRCHSLLAQRRVAISRVCGLNPCSPRGACGPREAPTLARTRRSRSSDVTDHGGRSGEGLRLRSWGIAHV